MNIPALRRRLRSTPRPSTPTANRDQAIEYAKRRIAAGADELLCRRGTALNEASMETIGSG